MTDPIHLGGNLRLPLDIALESIAIIARKGMGKTHTGRVLAEDFLAAHIPVVVIDPLDVWWGLRSNAKGDGPGESVVIFGGSHADIPLQETSGKAIADVVVDRGISAVLVVDHLSQGGQRRFVADFMEHLFERKGEQAHRVPLHLIMDEADAFAPQSPTPDGMRCLGAVDRAIRRGRTRGFGTTVISQRPAALNKNALTQSEVLISLQVTAPQDRAALKEWINANADFDQAKLFMDSLASMQRGDAWVWSPSKLQVFQRIKVRQTRTYDSSYTPRIGEKRPVAPTLKPVDLVALREQLGAIVAEAEANDPAKLKARIVKLEKELAAKPTSAPAIDPAQFKAEYLRGRKEGAVIQRSEFRKLLGKLIEALDTLEADILEPIEYRPQPARSASKTTTDVRRAPAGSTGDSTLTKAARAILTAVAQRHPRTSSKAQMAIMSGYSITSSSFGNALSELRSKGYITGPGDQTSCSSEGITAAGDVPRNPPVGEDRVTYWCGRIGKASREILRAIVDRYPETIEKEEISRATSYSVTSSSFGNALSELRTLELIDRGPIRASDALMGVE